MSNSSEKKDLARLSISDWIFSAILGVIAGAIVGGVLKLIFHLNFIYPFAIVSALVFIFLVYIYASPEAEPKVETEEERIKREKEGEEYLRQAMAYCSPKDVGRKFELQQAVQCGNIEAMYQLGRYWLNPGDRKLKSWKKAKKYFDMAAVENHAGAMYEIAMLYEWDKSINRRDNYHSTSEHDRKFQDRVYEEMIIYWLIRARELGNKDASKKLSLYDDSYMASEPERETAQKYLMNLCLKNGTVTNNLFFGYMDPAEYKGMAEYWKKKYEETKAKNEETATISKVKKENVKRRQELYKKGKELCSPDSSSEMYEEGRKYIIEAAELGDRAAAHWILFKKAESGNPQAEYKIGCERLSSDEEVLREAAFGWLSKALEHGVTDAKYQIALCHLRGIGTPKDEKLGWKTMEDAARCGVLNAQLDMGKRYCLGSERNVDRAERWLIPLTELDFQDDSFKKAMAREAWHSLALLYDENNKHLDIYDSLPRALDCAFNFLRLAIKKDETRGGNRFTAGEAVYPWIDAAQNGDPEIAEKLCIYIESKDIRGNGRYYESIARILRFRIIELYLPKAEDGDAEAMYQLCSQYGWIRNEEEQLYWGKMAIDAGHPGMLYFAAVNADHYGLSSAEANDFILRAADAGDEGAILELEVREMNREAQEERARMAEEYRVKKKMESYREKLDDIERGYNAFVSGNLMTNEEMWISGEISSEDGMFASNYRYELEQKHEKEIRKS